MIWDGPSIVEVARASGREPKRAGSRLRVRCPSPQHKDENPSCDLNDEKNVFHCHACGVGGGVVKFANLTGVMLKNLAWSPPAAVQALPRPVPVAKRKPFPVAEAKALWLRSSSVLDDPEVSAYLKSRGADPADVELHGLARAIPPGSEVPWWARCGGVSWTESGHRLLLPMHDRMGEIAGVRARRVFNAADELPKSLSPVGLSLKGVVLANSLARLLLADGRLGDGSPAVDLVREAYVVISEGEIDFLADASQALDRDELAPAVLGIGSGWWTEEIASRIPDGTTVAIRSQGDPRGNEYSREIGRMLIGRCNVIVLEGRS